MARVSTVQFNGSNAYELLQGDFITSFPFETVNFGNIAVSVQIYSFATTGKVRVKVKGFDKTGKMIVNVYQDFTPTQSNIWQMLEATWEVPTEMVKGEVQLESITGTNLIAQPKAISGTSAGAYSSNYSQQLTFITQTGIYTGTITAHQVILVDKENLSSRLVTINNALLSLQDRDNEMSTDITAQGLTVTSNKQSISANTSRIDSLNSSLGTQILKLGEIDKKTGELGLSVETIKGDVSTQSRSISSLTAGNLTLSTSTKGKIGSFTINSNYLISSSPDYEVRLSANSAYNAFQVSNKKNGEVNFIVAHNGHLYASSATITGDITAETGKIAGWLIFPDSLYKNAGSGRMFRLSGDSTKWNPITVSTSTGTQFTVDWNGKMFARNADIIGKITAESGTIGGWNITKSFIDSVNGRARVYLASHADTANTFLGITNSSGVTQFSVSKQGHLTANSATIKGTLQAGSIINGQLNNTSGTHTGYTTGRHSGSLYNVDGTYTGGLVNTTGTHTGGTTGQHSGSLYNTKGTHAGALYQTTGSHNGGVYSSAGSLGGSGYKVGTNGRLRFDSGIYVDGVTSINVGLRVYGNIVYSGTLTQDSDERLKQDIEDIPQKIVDELMNVKIKRFGYKTNPNEKHFGVIAQDLISDTSRNMSDVLVKPYEGYFTVSYEQFVPLLIKKVQDQEKRIKELEEKIA